ncbi:MAG TPA: hypothetical protein VHY20_15725, partial [Pirellulales bacterium]|nr:hypothetical protein [Pirellulales bacterium]
MENLAGVQRLPETDPSPLAPTLADVQRFEPPATGAPGARPESEVNPPPAYETPAASEVPPIPSSGALAGETAPIDLPSALGLAGVQNPDLLVARQRVVEAITLRQLAAAQILPNLNFGMNYDDHTG